jgi:nucleoid DNA-binding protein
MTEEFNAPKRKRRYSNPERASLNNEALARVNSWMCQLKPKLKGSKVSRSDLVNWFILQKSDQLGDREVADLVKAYFDPVKALEWAVAEVKSAKARGESIDLTEFVSTKFIAKPRKPRKRKEPKESRSIRPEIKE